MSNKEDQMGLPEKWRKLIDKMPEFKDEADAASVEDLKKKLVEAEGNIYTVEQEMAADNKLNSAKELVKEYSAGYREAVKHQTAKIKYCLWLLEQSHGISLDNKNE